MTTTEALVSMAQMLIRYDYRHAAIPAPYFREIYNRVADVGKLLGAPAIEQRDAVAELCRRYAVKAEVV